MESNALPEIIFSSFDKHSQRISKLEDSINLLINDVDTLEQYSKRLNLLLHGLPEKHNEDPLQEALNFLNSHFDINLAKFDIEAYRISPNAPTEELKESPRLLCIKFNYMFHKDIIYRNKERLKGTQYQIEENLTRKRQEIVNFLKEKKINFFTECGDVYIVNAENASKICVGSMEDVNNMKLCAANYEPMTESIAVSPISSSAAENSDTMVNSVAIHSAPSLAIGNYETRPNYTAMSSDTSTENEPRKRQHLSKGLNSGQESTPRKKGHLSKSQGSTTSKIGPLSKLLNSSQGVDFDENAFHRVCDHHMKSFIKKRRSIRNEFHKILKIPLQYKTKKRKKRVYGNIIRSVRALSRKHQRSSKKFLQKLASIISHEPVHRTSVKTIDNHKAMPENAAVASVSMSSAENYRTLPENSAASSAIFSSTEIRETTSSTEISETASSTETSETASSTETSETASLNTVALNPSMENFRTVSEIPAIPSTSTSAKRNRKILPESNAICHTVSPSTTDSCETYNPAELSDSSLVLENCETYPENSAVVSASSSVTENFGSMPVSFESLNFATDGAQRFTPFGIFERNLYCKSKIGLVNVEPEDPDSGNVNLGLVKTEPEDLDIESTSTVTKISETVPENFVSLSTSSFAAANNQMAPESSTILCTSLIATESCETVPENNSAQSIFSLTTKISNTVPQNPAVSPISFIKADNCESVPKNISSSDFSADDSQSFVPLFIERGPELFHQTRIGRISSGKRGHPRKP